MKDLPTEIWNKILEYVFKSLLSDERRWLRNIHNFLTSSKEDPMHDLDLHVESIFQRQKIALKLPYQVILVCKRLVIVDTSNEIWREIFRVLVGAQIWVEEVPQIFKQKFNGQYKPSCQHIVHLDRIKHDAFADRNFIPHGVTQSMRLFPPKEGCELCQQNRHHEHYFKYDGYAREVIELELPRIEYNQIIQADRKYYVITTPNSQCIVFDVEQNKITHEFSTEKLPHYRLFFKNIIHNKLVFSYQSLESSQLQTMVIDLNNGIFVINDDISNYEPWPDKPYYYSRRNSDPNDREYFAEDDKTFISKYSQFKILNEDNTISTKLIDCSAFSENYLVTTPEDSTSFIFLDNRLMVAVPNKGLFECNPITREILRHFSNVDTLGVNKIRGNYMVEAHMDPDPMAMEIIAQVRDMETGQFVNELRVTYPTVAFASAYFSIYYAGNRWSHFQLIATDWGIKSYFPNMEGTITSKIPILLFAQFEGVYISR